MAINPKDVPKWADVVERDDEGNIVGYGTYADYDDYNDD